MWSNSIIAAAEGRKARRTYNGGHDAEFSNPEIAWFSRNSYNLALKYCGELHPQCLLRLLFACIQVIEFLESHRVMISLTWSLR